MLGTDDKQQIVDDFTHCDIRWMVDSRLAHDCYCVRRLLYFLNCKVLRRRPPGERALKVRQCTLTGQEFHTLGPFHYE